MPQPLVWQKAKVGGTLPTATAGHNLTLVGSVFYLFGGIDTDKRNEMLTEHVDIDRKIGKITPNNILYSLKIGTNECTWNREKAAGEIPAPRTQHAACALGNDRLFVFGGYYSTYTRLNDVHIYWVPKKEWKQPENQEPLKGEPENTVSSIGAPDPRANHTATYINGKVYIFGGHGGVGYLRKSFNDLYSFDPNTMEWAQLEAGGNPPDARQGHTATYLDNNKLVIYGGISAESQFTDIMIYDIESNEWSNPDIENGMCRWNHCGLMVEAIPSWKYFAFGGSCGDFDEGQNRTLGEFSDDAYVLDAQDMKWEKIVTDDEEGLSSGLRPLSREHATVIYDSNESRLFVYGGWHNDWLSDLWSLNVSSVVGPPYAITSVSPKLGPLTGNTPVAITGIGFQDTQSISVRFSCGKISQDVSGTYVSPTELSCKTPNFEQVGPRKFEVTLSFKNKDYTTTSAFFSYFMNTLAEKCLAYGPGLLGDIATGHATVFYIQARNEMGDNRTSGRDRFIVRVSQGSAALEHEIIDHDDGSYEVKYETEEEGEVKVEVLFEGDGETVNPIRGSPFISAFISKANPKNNEFQGASMLQFISGTLSEIEKFLNETNQGISTKNKNYQEDVKALLTIKDHLGHLEQRNEEIVLKIDMLEESLRRFESQGHPKEKEMKQTKKLEEGWHGLQKMGKEVKKEIAPSIKVEGERTSNKIKAFEEELKDHGASLKKEPFYFYETGVETALQKLDAGYAEIDEFKARLENYQFLTKMFEFPDAVVNCEKSLEQLEIDLGLIKSLWDLVTKVTQRVDAYLSTKWIDVAAGDWMEEVKKFIKALREIKVDKRCDAYTKFGDFLKYWNNFLPLIDSLRSDDMRDRHWKKLTQIVNQDFVIDDKLTLKDMYDLNLNKHTEDVDDLTDQARNEARMEKTLGQVDEIWKAIEFEMQVHKGTDIQLLKLSEDNFELLEEHQVSVNNMFSSRFLATFEDECVLWQKSLAAISEVVQVLAEVQRTWSFLENLFIHSEEVKKELPKESEQFVDIDKEVKSILGSGAKIKIVLKFSNQDDILNRLEDVQKQLSVCEKALNDFLDAKRRAFPRFYFVSTLDLLDILSNGNNPQKVMKHMPKVFQAISELDLQGEGGEERPVAVAMNSCVGKESVKFSQPLKLLGKVEVYLQMVIDTMRSSLQDISKKSLQNQKAMGREEWLAMDPCQITLLMNLILWCGNVEIAFDDIAKGQKRALHEYYDRQVDMLTGLIKMVQGSLEKPLRQKVMNLITMDTHSRDIIDKLIKENVTLPDEFQWQSQLKAYWNPTQEDCQYRVADASFWYGYEYLGNGPRLVVTPLTDRIYVTATQALHLMMGCAPAGPAGTGKTETTKDLASAIGKACYVFNCSDQMDYRSMGDIYKGLASSGSWGCFDEFNRLVPEVLSVCSVQFKSVTDAIKEHKKTKATRFVLQGDEISLDPTCGVFITMNPGYLGRSELPEGLKSLFRPITVVVPDLELICENMLMAEGFVGAKVLARKFTTLYALCKDLLSKQDHYDWGLRAIKSVLVVAGGFKRAEPDLDEDALLMRALRDFNLPKIVAEDLVIFNGLLTDLFPSVDVPRKRDMDFEAICNDATADLGLHAAPEFILKVVQLSELLEIRHCVFVMGPAGASKSSTWKCLARAQTMAGKKTTVEDINPKGVSTNELYGYVQLSTREWKDGVLSKTMRSLGEINDTNPKWLVLDGDLDTNWIESMNSVMDDNKILTLASNERIPLKPHMRMLFEIRDLRFASPATVSRAGILYISDLEGHQWRSYVTSWTKRMVEKLGEETCSTLEKLFEKYVSATLRYLKKSCKFIIPVVDISMVISLCSILESVLKSDQTNLELWFVFCCVWAMGAGLSEKDGYDFRKQFSNWWKGEYKNVKFPGKGTVLDYFVDPNTNKLEEWNSLVTQIEYDPSIPMQNITVPTVETVSNDYFMTGFVNVGHGILLIGSAGCGKTQMCKGLLAGLNSDVFTYFGVNFNYYTDSALLQNTLEQPLEKKAGRQFGPPGKLKLVYFIDDLNMPMLDVYDTQTAIALLRQQTDYHHWYDRTKLMIRENKNCQMLCSMNPTAGSFSVNPRFQRHFWLLAVPFPEQASLITIYSTFMNGHFKKFKQGVQDLIQPVIKAALALHGAVISSFRKTAINFHYEFNIRHLSNMFQGLLVASPGHYQDPEKLVKMWIHESERTYGDRLVSVDHLNIYKGLANEISKKSFARFSMVRFFQKENPEPLIFATFAHGITETIYDQIHPFDNLLTLLAEALKEYNEMNAMMDLVLFDDACRHVCRICRIISQPQGHALLVGVGGSGKQSLSRLASFICQYTTVQITISQSYGLADLKQDLQNMYNKSGLRDEGILFLFTEGQITDERFLVYINDLLSSGEIVDLYAPDEKDTIVNGVRSAVKGAGIQDTKDNCWNFFIDRVKCNLHMALCFSPVGDAFRGRARKFPALVNCTVIDWFQPWPYEALHSVAKKFLADVDLGEEDVREAVELFMPYSFKIVNEASDLMMAKERRYCYTTPKSFLELIKLFVNMLNKKRGELEDNKDRLENGLVRLRDTQERTVVLEEELKIMQVEVDEKKKAADIFAEEVGREKAKVGAESDKANEEAAKCAEIQKNVEEQRTSCQRDLDAALPLVEKAEEALKTLNKKDFQEAKALNNPPAAVADVFQAVMFLLAGVADFVEIDKTGKVKEKTWKASQKMMQNPEAFLKTLMGYKDAIGNMQVNPANFKNVRPFLQPDFTREIIEKKSKAAGGVCDWVVNIVCYYDVVTTVEPKRQALKLAGEQLEAANSKLTEMRTLVAELEAKLAELVAEYDKAIAEKEAVEAEAQKCQMRLSLAQRLVTALGSENERWENSINAFGGQLVSIVGEVLLASAFVSYVGPFTKVYREELVGDKFLGFIKDHKIPVGDNPDPLVILTNEAEIAKWNNQKLPSDQVSVENGTILSYSERYPLMIDPQLQGITWIREREKGNSLQITRLGNRNMIRVFEQAIEAGYSVLLENLDEQVDAVLTPVISRATIKRGKSRYIKVGDKELNLSPTFRLFMHTKLSNPHYPPEVQAEATLINFTVTEAGLEDQLLSIVVRKERPDLAKQKEELIQEQNEFKIKLKELEDGLLYKLANADKDKILEDVELIENLEYSKKISVEIEEKVEIGKETSAKINETSEAYRPVAARGSLIFFLMTSLYKIHSFYMYSLESFVTVVNRAIDLISKEKKAPKEVEEGDAEEGEEGEKAEGEEGEKAEGEEAETAEADESKISAMEELSPRSLTKRVNELLEAITYQSYSFTRRGLFEKHKLIVATMLCLKVMTSRGELDPAEVDHFIAGKQEFASMSDNLRSFIPEANWAALKALDPLPQFNGLCSNMESDYLQWKKWYSEEKAESVDLPRQFKDLKPFHKLMLLRAMRPDRLTTALAQFVKENLGDAFIEQDPFSMAKTFTETNPDTPIFFVLFPGVDPTPDVERIGRDHNITTANGRFVNISMGQGQEEVAEKTLEVAAKDGGWVMLQNVHLMQSWLKKLERKLEEVSSSAHVDFRCFISSEPPALPDMKIIPESILQNCVKVANEAPQDIKANLRRAFDHFDAAFLDKSTKKGEFKALLFALCMFHSLVLGRRKFGSQGWSRHYSFNDGDLTICADVLYNYLERYEQVPYADLQYLYGEIMYGGHITDEWDRRTNRTYLLTLIRPELLSGMNLVPNYKSPDPQRFDHTAYAKYIEEKLPQESPQMFGMHPNAEIGYLTQTGETLLKTVQEVQGGSAAGGATGGQDDTIAEALTDFLTRLPEQFGMMDIEARIKDRTPFVIVCLQECERMNILLFEIKRSLEELQLGLQGALNITDAMEALMRAVVINNVPATWTKYAYFSKKSLANWFNDLLDRVQQLADWSEELLLPKALWISGLFNPMSFLTAIMQITAREKNLPLDSMTLQTNVTNSVKPSEITEYPDTGAYIHGLFLEGAGWELGRTGDEGYLTDSTLKDLHPAMPVVHVVAVRIEEKSWVAQYKCPVYVTAMRGPTYVFEGNLRMESDESDPNKWILAGVALLMADD